MKPMLMGILNMTPDSFFAPSRQNFAIFTSGADIVDIGAVSTRPGWQDVPLEEEWARLKPALERLPRDLPVSIDTFRSGIVRRALDTLQRPFWVNDVFAGEADPQMLPLVAAEHLPYVAMHHSGYRRLSDVTDFFTRFARQADALGIREWILDPGFGFGKDVRHNWRLLRHMDGLKVFGRPILAGVSRKRMTGGSAEVTEQAHLLALQKGADILRVHDVAAARKTLESYCPSSIR